MGVRAKIVDFPKSDGNVKKLVEWLTEYFNPEERRGSGEGVMRNLMKEGKEGVRVRQDRKPVYLQHRGHSRTVVGVERDGKGEWGLLVFDPAK
jgi:hypothetical protein